MNSGFYKQPSELFKWPEHYFKHGQYKPINYNETLGNDNYRSEKTQENKDINKDSDQMKKSKYYP